LRAIPVAIDEADARGDELVLAASETSLGMPLRLSVHDRLCLHPEQLADHVGQLTPAAMPDVRAAVRGDMDPRRQGALAPQGDAAPARTDPAVLMVLQQPWWRATGRTGG
jgi:hypothetical protein